MGTLARLPGWKEAGVSCRQEESRAPRPEAEWGWGPMRTIQLPRGSRRLFLTSPRPLMTSPALSQKGAPGESVHPFTMGCKGRCQSGRTKEERGGLDYMLLLALEAEYNEY